MKVYKKAVTLMLMSLLLVAVLMACSPSGSGGDLEPESDSVPVLDSGSWVLEAFGPVGEETAVLPNTSITLTFADGGINGSAGCNSYFGDMTQTGSQLSFGAIGSTRMACSEPSMQQENAYLEALAAVDRFSLGGQTAKEELVLFYADGRLVFQASPSSEASADTESGESLKTLFVGPQWVDCVGVAPQQCLQVRASEAAEWTLFYGQIDGFTFEPGYEYELRVQETEVENPPVDASSLTVTLVELVSKTAVSPTTEARPESSGLLGTSWVLESFGPSDNPTAVLPNTEITLTFDDAQINGNAGCNSYFADATFGEDGSLEFGMMGSTLMACLDNDVMQQESDYWSALAQVSSYSLAGNQLTLFFPNGTLEFVAATMTESSHEEAEVVDWETAVSILNSGEVTQIFQTHSLDVTLTLADGRIIQTVEPAIDDIFTAVQACGEPCVKIIMATE